MLAPAACAAASVLLWLWLDLWLASKERHYAPLQRQEKVGFNTIFILAILIQNTGQPTCVYLGEYSWLRLPEDIQFRGSQLLLYLYIPLRDATSQAACLSFQWSLYVFPGVLLSPLRKSITKLPSASAAIGKLYLCF